MPDLIDSAQLQATAQVAKSFILDQDTANVTTIINALQQGGGSTTAKTEPTLTIEYNSSTGEGSYTYDGDGEIFGYAAHKNNGSPYPLTIDRTYKTFSVTTGTGDPVPALVLSVTLHATEGENYAAKTAYFEGTVTPPGN